MPLTISHAKSDTIADFTGTVTVNNSAGNTTTALATDLVRPSDWNSGHQYTVGLSASEVASLFSAGNGLSRGTNAAGVTFGLNLGMLYEPFPNNNSNSVLFLVGNGTWYFDPFVTPFGLNSGRINLFNARDSSIFLNAVVAQSNSTGNMSATASFRNCLAIYSQITSASNSALTSVWTGEAAWSASMSRAWAGATSGMTVSNYLTVGFNSQFGSNGAVTSTTKTTSGTFSTGTTSMASTAPNSLITGALLWYTGGGSVMDIVPFSTSLPAGNYWMANMVATNSGGAGTTGRDFFSVTHTFFTTNHSRVGQFAGNLTAFMRQGFSTTPNSSSQAYPFMGSLLTSSTQATASVGTIDLVATTRRAYWNYVQDTL